MRMKKIIIFSFILLQIFFVAKKGVCANRKSEKHVQAIQNRIFYKYHELGVFLGYIGDDDFFNLYPVGFNYMLNMNEHWSWEVMRGYLVFDQEKDIRKDLEQKFGVKPSEFSKPKYMVHTHLVLKPMYGKDAVWNKRVVNHETYFFLGGGIINYEWQEDSGSETVPSVSLGVGIKYFLTKNLCLNVETRDLINIREEGTENNLWFSFGLGFRFNLSPRKAYEDSTIKTLNHYLNEKE